MGIEAVDIEKLSSYGGIILILLWLVHEKTRELRVSRQKEETLISMLLDIQKRTLETLHDLKDKIG